MDCNRLEKCRQQECWRFVRWMAHNDGSFNKVLDVFDGDAGPEEAHEALRAVVDGSFYTLVPLLLFRINETLSGSKALSKIFYNKFCAYLASSSSVKELCEEILQSLEEEAAGA